MQTEEFNQKYILLVTFISKNKITLKPDELIEQIYKDLKYTEKIYDNTCDEKPTRVEQIITRRFIRNSTYRTSYNEKNKNANWYININYDFHCLKNKEIEKIENDPLDNSDENFSIKIKIDEPGDFINPFEIKKFIIDEEEYITREEFDRKRGYKTAKLSEHRNLLQVTNWCGQDYVSYKIFIEDLKVYYNKHNPHVVEIHNMLGITTGVFTKEAKISSLICKFLTEKKITYELQYNSDEIENYIDIFIPIYNVAVKCGEKKEPKKALDILFYNPDECFNIVISELKNKLNTAKILLYKKNITNIKQFISMSLQHSLEHYYYKLFGDSLYGEDFIINICNIKNMLKYYDKYPKLRVLFKNWFIENKDYIIKKTTKEQIIITPECLRKFCLKFNNKNAITICDWYINWNSDKKN